jgi:hypothetical protein
MHPEQQLEGNVSLWAGICATGAGHAELYEDALNGARHRDLLWPSLISSFRDSFLLGPWIFRQDNAGETVAYLHGK